MGGHQEGLSIVAVISVSLEVVCGAALAHSRGHLVTASAKFYPQEKPGSRLAIPVRRDARGSGRGALIIIFIAPNLRYH